ncbi:MAG: GIY-YIG nuclease family protein [Paracoccus sp. (in: a-proteobacteria)]|uniref:GIY-YIG nuclease family protein n=1 Tax=Paracoccus sp. TaxID=267 RepID=UPI0040587FDC
MSFYDLAPADTNGGEFHPIYAHPIPDHWHDWAEDKGFEIVERVLDKNHLQLRCDSCGGDMVSKVFVLRSATPRCPHCLNDRRERLCAEAGVTFIEADGSHDFWIRLPCGHETGRQQSLLERVRAGEVNIRCEDCLDARLEAEAEARGWRVIDGDPDGDHDYLLYRHGCGHEQRAAIINMRTGRLTCHGCSDAWTSAPSYIYAMRFGLKSGRNAIKVGYSRDPWSRLRHQLVTDLEQDAELVRVIPIRTGHDAIRREKRLHAMLRDLHPEAVLEPAEFAGQVKVRSELYCASIEPEIMALLDDIELRVRSLAKRAKRLARRRARQEARRARNHQRRKRNGGCGARAAIV